MAKKIAKPAPKPIVERTLKPRRKPSQLDLVRGPNFDSAMAQQNFLNSLADLRAKAAAERGFGDIARQLPQEGGSSRFDDYRRQDPRDQNTRYKGPKAPTQPRLSPSSISPSSILNPETLTKAREEYVKQNPGEVNRQVKADLVNSRYLGQIGRGMSGFDKWFEKNYINNPNSSLSEQERMALNPQRGQRPPQGPQAPMIGYASQQPGNMPLPNIPQGPQVGGGEGLNYKGQQFDASEQPGYGDPYFQGSKRYQEREDYQNFLKQGGQRPPERPQVGGGMGELVPQRPNLIPQPGIRIPQGPQNAQDAMSAYNNLLQQGIQRSNTLNQDAASNFANMQAGAPIPQPATPAKANPTMPIAGMGMQQPKATPVPRKFSTVSNSPARFA